MNDCRYRVYRAPHPSKDTEYSFKGELVAIFVNYEDAVEYGMEYIADGHTSFFIVEG
jgi:hypothetical protein